MPTTPVQLDSRATRFAAAVAALILSTAVALGPTAGLPLLAVQLSAFAAGALLGIRLQPWVWAFRRFVGPRLRPLRRVEDEPPLRVAQAVGLILALAAALGGVLAQPMVFYVPAGLALIIAAVSAVTGVSPGSRRRSWAQPAAAATAQRHNRLTTRSGRDSRGRRD